MMSDFLLDLSNRIPRGVLTAETEGQAEGQAASVTEPSAPVVAWMVIVPLVAFDSTTEFAVPATPSTPPAVSAVDE